jgi:hypothetical protein
MHKLLRKQKAPKVKDVVKLNVSFILTLELMFLTPLVRAEAILRPKFTFARHSYAQRSDGGLSRNIFSAS